MATDRLYMVRAGRRARLVDEYLTQGIVAVAWSKLGSLVDASNEAEIRERLVDAYATSPTWRPSKHYLEISDFVLVAGPGTRVVTVDSPRRRFIVGSIVGPYEYWPDSTLRANEEPYRNVRRVKWDSVVGFDDLTKTSRKETDLQNHSAVWLSSATSADILANSQPFDGSATRDQRVTDNVAPVSEAPTDAAKLTEWGLENERRAATLPTDYLASKAAQASSEAKVVQASGKQFIRDPYVAAFAKRRAGGVCDLCGSQAPFASKNGDPYLEAHHVEWLSRGGADSVGNVAALCPNCHRRMHVVDHAPDIRALQKRLADRMK